MILGVSIGRSTIGVALVSKYGDLADYKLLPLRLSRKSTITMQTIFDEATMKHYISLARFVYLDRMNKNDLITIDGTIVYMNAFSFIRGLCFAMNIECKVMAQEGWRKQYGLMRKVHRFRWVEGNTTVKFKTQSGKYYDMDLPVADSIILAKIGAKKGEPSY